MLRLYGVPVPEADARRLIATLLADGGDIAESPATITANGLDRQLAIVALPIPERGRSSLCWTSPKGRSRSSAAGFSPTRNSAAPSSARPRRPPRPRARRFEPRFNGKTLVLRAGRARSTSEGDTPLGVEVSGPRRSLHRMVGDDDIERLRSEIGELRAAIDAAVESQATLGVLETLTLQFLERQQRLAELERRAAAG